MIAKYLKKGNSGGLDTFIVFVKKCEVVKNQITTTYPKILT